MKSIFSIFKRGLLKTKTTLVRNLSSLFTSNKKWTNEDYESLEAILLSADIGYSVTAKILSNIKERYELGEIKTVEDILFIAEHDIKSLLSSDVLPLKINEGGLTVVFMVGVNGTGKTTTTAKLANMWKEDGKKVMLAACDTFRAAAVEQLKIWGNRTNCHVVAGKHGADSSSVAYDAVSAALSRNVDILIIDTAGRQHTKKGLMEELSKIKRTVGRVCPGAPHETWLIVDGGTGSNALVQSREFGKYCDITGLCLTKLDGTGKGGVVVAIHEELAYPIRFIGLGEGVNDLQPFDAELFTNAIFKN